MPQGANDIRSIEARGGVTVISKDQKASGDIGVYDLKKKTITLTGNVVVSQGKNVLHGDRVVVDTVTGNAHFESARRGPSRVRALILPSKDANGGPSNIHDDRARTGRIRRRGRSIAAGNRIKSPARGRYLRRRF